MAGWLICESILGDGNRTMLLPSGAHAANLIKAFAPIAGGGGGGRPNMAQAGGKNSAIDELIAKVPGYNSVTD